MQSPNARGYKNRLYCFFALASSWLHTEQRCCSDCSPQERLLWIWFILQYFTAVYYYSILRSVAPFFWRLIFQLDVRNMTYDDQYWGSFIPVAVQHFSIHHIVAMCKYRKLLPLVCHAQLLCMLAFINFVYFWKFSPHDVYSLLQTCLEFALGGYAHFTPCLEGYSTYRLEKIRGTHDCLRKSMHVRNTTPNLFCNIEVREISALTSVANQRQTREKVKHSHASLYKPLVEGFRCPRLTPKVHKTSENKPVETSFIKAVCALEKPKFTAVNQSDSDISSKFSNQILNIKWSLWNESCKQAKKFVIFSL